LPVLGKRAGALGVSLDVLVVGGDEKPNGERSRGRSRKVAGAEPAAKTRKRKRK